MKKNYIILAHKNPNQLRVLIESINDFDSFFFIHIDKNVDIIPFQKAVSPKSNIHFIEKRESSMWGDLGLVLATINGLKVALEHKNEGYFILLSGQDLPIKSNDYINNYLKKYNGHQFIDISPLDDLIKTKEWVAKLQFYKYNLSIEKSKYILMPPLFHRSFFSIETLKNFIKITINFKNIEIKEILINLFRKRTPPLNIVPYGGGQWWALSSDMVCKILDFLDANQDFINYHKNTLIPDEIFFQSIIMYLAKNDTTIKFKNCFTYVNFSRKNCYLPVEFEYNQTDINELFALGDNMLFARKFDGSKDEKIIDYVLDNRKN